MQELELIVGFDEVYDIFASFVIGLLIGLSIRHGAASFVMTIVALAIAFYVGVTFVIKASIVHYVNFVWSIIFNYINGFQLAALAFSIGIMVFFFGLVIGVWKY